MDEAVAAAVAVPLISETTSRVGKKGYSHAGGVGLVGRSEPLGGRNREMLKLAGRLGRRRRTGSGRVCGRIRSSLVVPPRWAWTGDGGGGGVGGGRGIGLGLLLSGTLRPRLKSIPGVSLCDRGARIDG